MDTRLMFELMSCPVCENITERTDVPHVIRTCSGCGREMHMVEPGEHGRGIMIRAGDRFAIPEGWLKIALNPIQSTGHLSRAGMDMLATQLFMEGLPGQEETYADAAAELERQADGMVHGFPPLNGLDINNGDDAEKIHSIMQAHKNTREFWALWTGQFLGMAREARKVGDIDRAMWATACAERFRAMMVYKGAFEDVVWMGHSAKRVIDILGVWDAQRTNKDEEFWQLTFNENSYVLSQVFAVPLVFIKD